jgi:hypothetical protein
MLAGFRGVDCLGRPLMRDFAAIHDAAVIGEFAARVEIFAR